MESKDMDLFQTLCFLICMQHGEGLIAKAPAYIREKQEAIQNPLAAWQMLDGEVQVELLKWSDKWEFPIADCLKEIYPG